MRDHIYFSVDMFFRVTCGFGVCVNFPALLELCIVQIHCNVLVWPKYISST